MSNIPHALIDHNGTHQWVPITCEPSRIAQGGIGFIARISQTSHEAILAIKQPIPKTLVAKLPHRDPNPLQCEMAALDRLCAYDRQAHHHWPPYAYLYASPPQSPIRVGYLMPAATCDFRTAASQRLFDDATMATLCRTLFDGLTFLHDHRMAHGDVKGSNVLVLRREGNPERDAIVRWGDFNNIDLNHPTVNTSISQTPSMHPPSVREKKLDTNQTQTWVHIDRYSWALMTCWELNPTYQRDSPDHFFSPPKTDTESHPEWPTIRGILNQERCYGGEPPLPGSDLLDTLKGWTQSITRLLPQD